LAGPLQGEQGQLRRGDKGREDISVL
jgi:hypothetical protein